MHPIIRRLKVQPLTVITPCRLTVVYLCGVIIDLFFHLNDGFGFGIIVVIWLFIINVLLILFDMLLTFYIKKGAYIWIVELICLALVTYFFYRWIG